MKKGQGGEKRKRDSFSFEKILQKEQKKVPKTGARSQTCFLNHDLLQTHLLHRDMLNHICIMFYQALLGRKETQSL